MAEGRGTPKGRGATGGARTGGGRAAPKTARAAAGTSKTPRRSPRPTGTGGSASYGQGRTAAGRGGSGQEPRTGRDGVTGDHRRWPAAWSSDVRCRRPAPDVRRPAPDTPDIVAGPDDARVGQRPRRRGDPATIASSRTRWRTPGPAVGRLRWNPPDLPAAGGRRNPGSRCRRTAPDRPPACGRRRSPRRPATRAGGSAPGHGPVVRRRPRGNRGRGATTKLWYWTPVLGQRQEHRRGGRASGTRTEHRPHHRTPRAQPIPPRQARHRALPPREARHGPVPPREARHGPVPHRATRFGLPAAARSPGSRDRRRRHGVPASGQPASGKPPPANPTPGGRAARERAAAERAPPPRPGYGHR